MKELSEVQSIFEAKFGKYNENFNYKQKDTDFLMSFRIILFDIKIKWNYSVTHLPKLNFLYEIGK